MNFLVLYVGWIVLIFLGFLIHYRNPPYNDFIAGPMIVAGVVLFILAIAVKVGR